MEQIKQQINSEENQEQDCFTFNLDKKMTEIENSLINILRKQETAGIRASNGRFIESR